MGEKRQQAVENSSCCCCYRALIHSLQIVSKLWPNSATRALYSAGKSQNRDNVSTCFMKRLFSFAQVLKKQKKFTLFLSHSFLRWSNTTALQQLPVGDHGGRMNTHIKGSAVGARRPSARLKKWEAFRPHTSARPSSLNNAKAKCHR